MKKRLLAALATGLLVVGMGGMAQALTITPSTVPQWTGTDNEGWLTPIDDAYETLLYKAEYPSGEDGSFDESYGTSFIDASNGTITYDGSPDPFITGTPLYFLVKDGYGNDPSWYLFNISGWNGTESITFSGFWPAGVNGSISQVSILGGGGSNEVPEPATMLLFGTGLAGLAGVARRRKKA